MHKEWADYINQQVAGANAVVNEAEVGDSSITVSSEKILEVCVSLKDGDHDFTTLQVITGADFLEDGELEISYILASFTKNTELILKVRVPRGDGQELPKLNSVCSVWKSANFQERECYDMVGVEFVNHPDFRRILCPDDWTGYPLRKDYVVQEKYLDMTVNPIEKMNIGDREFGAKHKHMKGAITSVDNYTVDAPESPEAPEA